MTWLDKKANEKEIECLLALRKYRTMMEEDAMTIQDLPSSWWNEYSTAEALFFERQEELNTFLRSWSDFFKCPHSPCLTTEEDVRRAVYDCLKEKSKREN